MQPAPVIDWLGLSHIVIIHRRALDLPRIGDAFRFDYEAIAALRPDLLLALAIRNAGCCCRAAYQPGLSRRESGARATDDHRGSLAIYRPAFR